MGTPQSFGQRVGVLVLGKYQHGCQRLKERWGITRKWLSHSYISLRSVHHVTTGPQHDDDHERGVWVRPGSKISWDQGSQQREHRYGLVRKSELLGKSSGVSTSEVCPVVMGLRRYRSRRGAGDSYL